MPKLLWQTGPVAESVPRVTFTEPEVASVGLSLSAARPLFPDAQQTVRQMARFDRAVCEGKTAGQVVIVHRGLAGVLLGASAVGAGAGELVAELALARKAKLKLAKLATTMHPYPAMAYGLQIAAGESYYSWIETRTRGALVSFVRACSGGPHLHGRPPS